MNHPTNVIALESRLRHCTNVITLGVRPNFSDYSEEETSLIINSERVYYPSSFYADMFDAMGKNIFPCVHTYRFAQDKIKQTALFKLLKIPHPVTRTFYAKSKREKILSYFNFPFIGKIPRGSALGRGVFLIHNQNELEEYCRLIKVAYIQEYLPIDRDIRAVIIGDRVVHAYWRINPSGEFRSNVGLGAEISFNNIPEKALELALDTARRCGWNDVGIDICECENRYYVLEANMKYGKAGFKKAGIDYNRLMEAMIRNGEI
ncbi:MAG: RimK family alpha-L-glutamate ligase [Desulfobacteraceae bacterium]|nr:RimK family alpha-L-glutamate ligase [Desulfobacteraceae bacterium]MBC2756687.1 RimK family alpha-L-glutamate ligase [Desulfobacteraceae bacterium]